MHCENKWQLSINRNYGAGLKHQILQIPRHQYGGELEDLDQRALK